MILLRLVVGRSAVGRSAAAASASLIAVAVCGRIDNVAHSFNFNFTKIINTTLDAILLSQNNSHTSGFRLPAAIIVVVDETRIDGGNEWW